jgi:hypothetical protein
MEVLLTELAAGQLSPTALRVYADRLLERGDVHGEFITLQCERVERGVEEASVREEQLRRDVLEPRLQHALGSKLRVTKWHLGLISEVELEVNDAEVTELATLAERPEAIGLTSVVLDALAWDGGGDLTPLWASLLRTPRFPSLRELRVRVGADFGNPHIDGPITIGKVAPLYAAYPGLHVLELHGMEHTLGDIVLPELRRFSASELRPECIASLVNASWPKLEELELEFGPAPAESERVRA